MVIIERTCCNYFKNSFESKINCYLYSVNFECKIFRILRKAVIPLSLCTMKLFYLTIFTFLSLYSFSEGVNYGIYIRSYPARNSSWSELEIEYGKAFHLRKHFSLGFEIYIRDDCPFGYVFRSIGDDSDNIDLFFTVGEGNKRYPAIRVLDSIYVLKHELRRNTWLPVKLEINKPEKNVILKFGAESRTINYKSGAKELKFVFGKSMKSGIETKDIASVNLRDIKVESNHRLIRHWPLKKYNNNISYDELKNVPAISKNAQWLIEDHLILKLILKKEFDLAPSVTFNSHTGEFYIVNDSEEILVFNGVNYSTDTLKVSKGNFVAHSPNQLMYLENADTLLSYRIEDSVFSFFNFKTNAWSDNSHSFEYTHEHKYWNNSTTFHERDSVVYSFGGYGYYQFNNDLVMLNPFKLEGKYNRSITLRDIPPRSAVATAIAGDTLYLFGGRGSISGHQEISPQNFYDFYIINLKRFEIDKRFELNNIHERNFLPSENMIYNKGQDCFYTFVNQNGGKIIQIIPDKNLINDVSLSLDLDFTTQYQYTNLYYSDILKRFFVLINRINIDDTSQISIYSINAPLIPVDSIFTYSLAKRSFTPAIIIISSIFLGLFVIVVRKLRVRRRRPMDIITEEINLKDKTSCIFSPKNFLFLGPFQIIDRNGNDISTDFTPTLRKLFIVLTLHTYTNKGISGKEMISLIWPDKDIDSAKNSRSVYINKLRALTNKIGGTQIVNKNGIWTLEVDDDIKTDYIEAIRMFNKINMEQLTDEEIIELIGILSRGPLLSDFDFEWLDNYKNDFSNRTIDILYTLLNNNSISASIKLKICDILFKHDFLNEKALIIKCKILNNHGKMGIAKNVYDIFCIDYENSYGIKYNKTLTELLKFDN